MVSPDARARVRAPGYMPIRRASNPWRTTVPRIFCELTVSGS